MKNKVKIILPLFCMMIILIVGCNKKNEENNKNTTTKTQIDTVILSGSTSVGSLIEKEGEVFEKNNSNILVEVNEIGSSKGIKDVINGNAEIGMLSRDLKEEEIEEDLVEVEIAIDGIVLITSKNNKIDSLSTKQIKDIYTGKITNWKDVGGDDLQIVVVSREYGSGTRDVFEKLIGYTSEELYKDAIIENNSVNIKNTVDGNDKAIGFISFECIDDLINIVKIDNIPPTLEKVKNGEYKLSRPFLLVYKEEKLNESGNKLIDFILSNEGQEIIKDSGLIKVN